jgi:hypothetical protein
MKNKNFWLVIHVFVVLVLAMGASALAQAPTPRHFSGLINDYTPATIGGKVVGPWEIRGQWSLKLKGESGLADFSAVVNMELSDHGIDEGTVQVDNPTSRIPHTHHITMTDATVSLDTSVCPPFTPPATPAIGPGFVVNGPVSVTGNGTAAGFEAKGTSTLRVCVTGGPDVQFSNVTLEFAGQAPSHFGTQAIHGVVRKATNVRHDDEHR